jgi:hypothetical protein
MEVSGISAILECEDGHNHTLDLDDVAVVGSAWAIRDKVVGEFAGDRAKEVERARDR